MATLPVKHYLPHPPECGLKIHNFVRRGVFVILGTPPSTPNTGTPSELPTTSAGNTGTGTTGPSDSVAGQAGSSRDNAERTNMFGGK